jgi:hypothetical protein
VSSPSQPNSLIVVRYSSRNNTAADHAMITWGQWNLSSSLLWRVLAHHRSGARPVVGDSPAACAGRAWSVVPAGRSPPRTLLALKSLTNSASSCPRG